MSTSEFVREFVVDTGLRLGVGESIRTVCPMCRAVHEKSFSIQKDSYELRYHCWRASCGCRGAVWSVSDEARATARGTMPPQKKLVRPFTYSTTPLPPLVLSILEEKYNLTEEDFSSRSIKWSEELESLVFPCFDFDAHLKGVVTKRLFKKDGVNKSLLFWDEEPPRYFTTRWRLQQHPYGSVVYLVEDCLSALRIWQAGGAAIALLGTKLDDKTALEISKVFRNVVFCLDNDATAKSVELSRKYNLLFDKVSILVPPVEPKDMQPEELENLLYAGS